MSLPTMLLLLQAIAPDTVRTVWNLTCAVAIVVGLALGIRLQLIATQPTVTRPLPVTPGGVYAGRHWAVDPAADSSEDWWRASHTAAAVEHGRHHDGERKWSGNLLEHTHADLTATQLADAMAGVR